MRVVVLVATSALVLTASASLAVDTTEIEAQVAGEISGIPLSDNKGPASADSLLATADWGPGQGFNDPTGSAIALAAQHVDGRSAVLVEATPLSPAGDHQNAETRWMRSLTHPGPTASEYVYEFTVTPARLALRNTSASDTPSAWSHYDITVTLDGLTIFHSSATLSMASDVVQLMKNGTEFGETYFSYPSSGIFGYDFNAYTGMISLGNFMPGETITVESRLRVHTEIHQGMGAHANIGDPLDMGGEPGFDSFFYATGFVGVESAGWSAIKALYR